MPSMSNKELELNTTYKNDLNPAQKLFEKSGIGQNIACELIGKVPVINENFSGFSLGKDIVGYVYISYADPESAMKPVRCWQKITGCNLDTEISGIKFVCGNVAVESYIDQKICISFGCPDSGEYANIEKGRLVIGLPHNIAFHIGVINSSSE